MISSTYEVEVEGREQHAAWCEEQRAEAAERGVLDAELEPKAKRSTKRSMPAADMQVLRLPARSVYAAQAEYDGAW